MTAEGRTTVRKPTTPPSRSHDQTGLRAYGGARTRRCPPASRTSPGRLAMIASQAGASSGRERPDRGISAARACRTPARASRGRCARRENRSSFRSTAVASSKLIHSSPGPARGRTGRGAPRGSRRPAPLGGSSPDTAAPRTAVPVHAASVSQVPIGGGGVREPRQCRRVAGRTRPCRPSARSPRGHEVVLARPPRAPRSGARSPAPCRSRRATAGRPRRRRSRRVEQRCVPISLASIRSCGARAGSGTAPRDRRRYTRADERVHGSAEAIADGVRRGPGVPLTSTASARARPTLQQQAADPVAVGRPGRRAGASPPSSRG